MKNIIKFSVFAALSFAASSPAYADDTAWLDDGLSVRKEIVLQPGSGGAGLDEPVAQFPFLLRLSPQTADFDKMQPNGSDLRVAGPDGEPVAHYVESIDPKAGLAAIWVGGTDVDPAHEQSYHLYYGGTPESEAPRQADLFDASEVLAFDFSGTGPVVDRTSSANKAGTVARAAGFAGRSAVFDGAQTLVVPDAAGLRFSGPFTAMVWVKPAAGANGNIIARQGVFSIGLNAGVPVATIGETQLAAATAIDPESWTHLALVQGADGRATLYVNGQPAGSGQATTGSQRGNIIIGQGFAGQIDNLRLAKTARTSDYINAVALSDNGRGLVTFGADEEKHGGGFEVGYFVTVVKNVTLEGWIVIGLCAILLVLALMVMVQKSRAVGRIERENRSFDEVYGQASRLRGDDLSAAAKQNSASTLAQLYEAGMVEITRHSEGQEVRFRPSAIEALRARIDSVASNQAYSLSDKLVILTLSIAGGPFLGLLGTVIGVMITFAAIAAEGNVNVNSIAPGVAAALLATAAGLAVAIPALFGYNLILTRIKKINAENRAFADTLVARIADQYGA